MTANGNRRIIEVENGGNNGIDRWQIDDDRLIGTKNSRALQGPVGMVFYNRGMDEVSSQPLKSNKSKQNYTTSFWISLWEREPVRNILLFLLYKQMISFRDKFEMTYTVGIFA